MNMTSYFKHINRLIGFMSVLLLITSYFLPQIAPSVPRKLKAQWNMGIIQAKEALNMSLNERMVNFKFVYDEVGPHLNPQILDKLKPEEGVDIHQDSESRLCVDPPALAVRPVNKVSAALKKQYSEPNTDLS